MRPWTPADTLWYDYRDPWAEGAPGALERLVALRRPGGWLVPAAHDHGETFIPDGSDRDADVAWQELQAEIAPQPQPITSIRDLVRRERWASAFERATAEWPRQLEDDGGVVVRTGANVRIHGL
jgi:hypothetical protein